MLSYLCYAHVAGLCAVGVIGEVSSGGGIDVHAETVLVDDPPALRSSRGIEWRCRRRLRDFTFFVRRRRDA